MPSNTFSRFGESRSTSFGRAVSVAVGWTLAAAVGVVNAQPELASPPAIGPLARLSASVLSFLLVGGVTLGAKPAYASRVEDRIRTSPGRSFLWGVGAFVAFVGSIVVLAITQVGILLAIPLAIVFVVVGAVGNVLAYLTLVRTVLDGRLAPLVAGAVLSAVVVSIPVLGQIAGFVVGSLGVGGMALDYRS